MEPFQRYNLHPPVQGVLVLLARWRRCDEVGDGFGEIAVVLGSVGVYILLYALSLLSYIGQYRPMRGDVATYGCRSL